MCDHYIRGAGVVGVRGWVSRTVAGPADEGFLAGRDIDAERFGTTQLRFVVARVVLGHDRRKRLSCLRHNPVRGVVEERVAPGDLWSAVAGFWPEGQHSIEAAYEADDLVHRHAPSVSLDLFACVGPPPVLGAVTSRNPVLHEAHVHVRS